MTKTYKQTMPYKLHFQLASKLTYLILDCHHNEIIQQKLTPLLSLDITDSTQRRTRLQRKKISERVVIRILFKHDTILFRTQHGFVTNSTLHTIHTQHTQRKVLDSTESIEYETN
jgi:hypothetical protein